MKLKEIEFIKPLLIVILVAYHSFLPYAVGYGIMGGGNFLTQFTAYHIFDKLLYSFMLESFTFVSGFLFCLQLAGGRYVSFDGFKNLVKKKTLHLLLPCFLFSLPTFVVFDHAISFNTILKSFCGWNHLWYLPSLFTCFLVAFSLDTLRIKTNYSFVLLTFITIILTMMVSIPRLSFTLYLLCFFILGMDIFKRRKAINVFIGNHTYVIMIGWVLWIVLFAVQTYFYLNYLDGFAERYTIQYLALKYATSIMGVISLYFTACFFTGRYRLSDWYIRIGRYCFGVYIMHQYLIYWICEWSNLLVGVDPLYIPWFCTGITLIGSLFFSFVLSKTYFIKSII